MSINLRRPRRRPTRLLTALAGALMLALGACSSAGAPAPAGSGELVKLRVSGPSAPGLTDPKPLGAAGYAISKGAADQILKSYGFVYDGFAAFPNGPPAAQALASGSVQLSILGDAPALLSRASGQENRAILLAATPGGTWIAARKGGPKSIDDLAGAKIGTQFGSNFDRYVRFVLEDHGLLDKVQLVNLTGADAYAALTSGALDAYAMNSPLVASWEEKGGITVIGKAEVDYPGYFSASATLVNQSFLDQHPTIQQAWWAVYDEGQKLIKKDPDAYLAWVAENSGVSRAIAKKVTVLVQQDEPVTAQAIRVEEETLQFLLDQKTAKQRFAIKDWVVPFQPDTSTREG
jgi:sulfonate transport system substrate-binding protein